MSLHHDNKTGAIEGCCNRKMRWDFCAMDAGHRGRCASWVYRCDGCGKTRRGQPHRWSRDGEYERGLAFCFMCVLEDERDAEEWQRLL